MILAQTFLLLAALVPPGKPIAVAVEVAPGAVKSRVAPFDPGMLRQALVRELQASGVAIGTSPDLLRLVVRVAAVDPGNTLALGQTATLSATAELQLPGEPNQPGQSTALPPASCANQAKFGLLSTPGQRARLALTRCIDQLAGQISASVAGGNETVVVR